MKNILTFDIEDWYHPNLTNPEALAKLTIKDRVVEPTLKILNMLDDTRNRATFFVVGDVAEKFPDLVKEIVIRGHEVASHGFRHNLVYDYTKTQFETDIENSLTVLESAAGRKILGYRAPSWSLNDKTPWAWQVLADHGFQYDSSLYPFKTFLYGSNASPMFKYDIEIRNGKQFTELPPSVIEIVGKRLPFSGGFYFRVSPLWYLNWCIRRINKKGQPALIYLHPWEIDVEQPRLDVSAKERFILYANLDKTEEKLLAVLQQQEFISIKEHLSLRQEVLDKEATSLAPNQPN